MTDNELLAECKDALNIQQSTTAFDSVLTQKLLSVKSYMKGAGISDVMMNDDQAVEVIVMGIGDLWNVEGGEIKFSSVFHIMLTQLAARSSILTVSSTPAEGATGIVVGVHPVLTFDRRIKSYKISIVTYDTQEAITVEGSLDVTGKVLIITPSSNLTASTKYAIVIESAAAYSGQTLDYAVISFTTA